MGKLPAGLRAFHRGMEELSSFHKCRALPSKPYHQWSQGGGTQICAAQSHLGSDMAEVWPEQDEANSGH